MPAAERGRREALVGGMIFGGLVSSALCLASIYGARSAGYDVPSVEPIFVFLPCFSGAAAASWLAAFVRGRTRHFARTFMAIAVPLAVLVVAAVFLMPGLPTWPRLIPVPIHAVAVAGIILPVLALHMPARRSLRRRARAGARC